MIVFVDIEHQQAVRRGAAGDGQHDPASSVPLAYLKDVQHRLETIAEQRCVLRSYAEVRPDSLDLTETRALILSGNMTEWDVYGEGELNPLTQIIRRASLPILGLCGGLQLIAMAHGACVGPMRALDSNEQDVNTGFGGGYLKEWGFTPVRLLRSDPLFEGLEAPVFLEAHYWEVKSIPDGFELLAATDTCRIQALRRTGTQVYGTQFHPEAYIAPPSRRRNWLVDLVYPSGYDEDQPDGRRLLTNFFRAAGVLS